MRMQLSDFQATNHTALRLIWTWAALAVLLVGACLGLAAFSTSFAYALDTLQRPAIVFCGALMCAGFVSMLSIPLIQRSLPLDNRSQRTILAIITAGGLMMRLAFMGSTPILEDDYYRYLWDGGVTAHGYNPFAASPDDAQGEPYFYTLQALAHQSGIVIERINHSNLTTVYPPGAQAAFALAHFISPWSLMAWRGVCLAAELATLMLLLSLLDQVGRSRLWVALYWLSPLAAKEFINSAHMDSIVMPLVLGAALLSLRQRSLGAIALLGLAAGVKFWPILLAPLLLRPLIGDRRRLAIAFGLLVCLTLAAIAPMLHVPAEGPSGLSAYASTWRNNSGHYALIEHALAFVLKPFGASARIPGEITRFLLAGFALCIAVWAARAPIEGGRDMMNRLGAVTTAIVLLSPSQFPWYALWVLPFAVFTPWAGLLAMIALMPIYYAGFHFLARDTFYLYRDGLVYAIWLPVWALLALEARRVLIEHEPPLIGDATSHA